MKKRTVIVLLLLLLSGILFVSSCGTTDIEWNNAERYAEEIAFTAEIGQKAAEYWEEYKSSASEELKEYIARGEINFSVSSVNRAGDFYLKSYYIGMTDSDSFYEVYYKNGEEFALLESSETDRFIFIGSDGGSVYYADGEDGKIKELTSDGKEIVVRDGDIALPDDIDDSYQGETLKWSPIGEVELNGNTVTVELIYSYKSDSGEVKRLTEKIEIKL